MKTMLLLVAAILSFAAAKAAEYVTLNVGTATVPGNGPNTRSLTVSPADVVHLVSFLSNQVSNNSPIITLVMADGTRTFFHPSADRVSQTPPIFTGVREIELSVSSTAPKPAVATFKITKSESDLGVVASNVAVIPNDANGQFEVVLESSVDLVTWTPANPGTFGGDTPRRFFRTRILRRD